MNDKIKLLGLINKAKTKQEPRKTRRFPIGFDSISNIDAGATTNLIQRSQYFFRPERIIIPYDIAPFFLIHEVTIGMNSQMISSSGVSALAFTESSNAVLGMDTIRISQDMRLSITNIGVESKRFLAWITGEAFE